MATAEFSKFAGIFSAALSQHYLSGFETDSLLLYSYTCLYSDISDLTYSTLNFDNHLSSKNKQKKKKEEEEGGEEEKPMLLSDLQNLSKWQF